MGSPGQASYVRPLSDAPFSWMPPQSTGRLTGGVQRARLDDDAFGAGAVS